MNGCPHCGSSAQLFQIEFKTIILENEISLTREYRCGCGHYFKTIQHFVSEEEEKVEEGE